MLGQEYTVRKGDTLWDLSKKFLGDPLKWPAIYEHNNKSEVVAKTRMRIENPDLIFVNQKIFIPLNPATVRTASPSPENAGKVPAKQKFRSIPFKYDLEDVPLSVIKTPLYTATVKLVGTVTIQSEKTFDILSINKDGFEVAAKQEADAVFNKLIGEATVGWNSKTKEVKFGIKLTAQSNDPFAPIISVSSGVSSINPGVPCVKISIKAPPAKIIRGKFAGHFYAAMDFGVEIEITQDQDLQPAGARSASPLPQTARSASPLPNTTTVRVPPMPSFPNMAPNSSVAPPNSRSAHPGMEHSLPPNNSSSSNGSVLFAAILAVGAVVLVAATIAEDVATAGAGTADDVASFAAAASMLDKASKLYRATRAIATVSRGTPAFAY